MKSKPCRNHVSALLLLLLLTTTPVGSEAGALPHIKSIVFKSREYENTSQVCVGTSTTSSLFSESGNCVINRGGAASSVAASTDAVITTSESALTFLGVVGSWLAFRDAITQRVQEFWADADRFKFLLAGAIAGVVSRTAVAPLEVVATAQMVRGGNKNMITELTEIFRAEGVSGLFKGNGANCLKVAPTRGVQFFAFESFKGRIVEWKRKRLGASPDDNITLTPIERLVAGGFAGMIASSLVYPLEVVKTMLTMYPGRYSSIGAAFAGVIQDAGPRGLYQGLTPTLFAMFPYVGVEFMIYETSKIALEAIIKRRANEAGEDPVLATLPVFVSLGLGALAGAAAQSSAHPLDVVRKRLQVQGINGNPVLYKNTIDCMVGVARKNGIGALYKGVGPACVATIPGTGIAYITYEVMKKVLGLSSV